MAQQAYQAQFTQVTADGTEVLIYPVSTGKEVNVGNVTPASSLQLPGSSAQEKLETSIAKIKLYLTNLTGLASTKRSVTDDPADNSTNIPTTKATASLKSAVDSLNTAIQKLNTTIANVPPKSHASTDTKYGAGNADNYGHVKLSDTYNSVVEGAAATNSVAASQNALGNAYVALNNAKAPKSHAASDTTYGAGNATNYGHVKLSDTYNSVVSGAAATNSVAASQNALGNAYIALNNAKAPKSHAASDTTYGAGTATNYGHVKLSDTYKSAVSNGAAANGVAASQNALANAYAELTSANTGLAGKAPNMHAVSEKTYGVGTDSVFGHLKISDAYDMSDVANAGSAAAGMTASMYALSRARSALQSSIDTKLASSHANEKATDSAYSHVKLSDSYTSNSGAASSAVGASSKAVYDAYTNLNNKIVAAQKSIATLNSAIATEGCKIVFNDDGSITETGDTYVKTTSFASSYIMETYTANDGSLSKTMKTTFNSDGSISKEVS